MCIALIMSYDILSTKGEASQREGEAPAEPAM